MHCRDCTDGDLHFDTNIKTVVVNFLPFEGYLDLQWLQYSFGSYVSALVDQAAKKNRDLGISNLQHHNSQTGSYVMLPQELAFGFQNYSERMIGDSLMENQSTVINMFEPPLWPSQIKVMVDMLMFLVHSGTQV